MPNSPSSHAPPLPSRLWIPSTDASICVYWDCLGPDTFSIALQLLDRSYIAPGESGIIVHTTMSSPRRIQVPFSLTDALSGTTLVSGRFVLRADAHGTLQLWLADARYPDGFTEDAQISGPET